MYQQFKKDPSSVDDEWKAYFSKGGTPEAGLTDTTSAPATKKAPTTKRDPQPRDEEQASNPDEAKSGLGMTEQEDHDQVAEHAFDSAPEIKRLSDAEEELWKKKLEHSPLSKIADKPEPGEQVMKGIAKATAKNMDISLEVPTATSVKDMPAKLMFENRSIINAHLKRTRGGKISFTHIIGWAIVKAVQIHPAMNVSYEEKDGKRYFVP